MSKSSVVRVAAIQATPEILDFEGCLAKTERLLAEAAAEGVRLAVLPETFVPLYPSGAWAAGAASFSGWDVFWEKLWNNSVDVPGPLARYNTMLTITMLTLGPEGVAGQAPQADADHARANLPRDRCR